MFQLSGFYCICRNLYRKKTQGNQFNAESNVARSEISNPADPNPPRTRCTCRTFHKPAGVPRNRCEGVAEGRIP